jgi:protein TonB
MKTNLTTLDHHNGRFVRLFRPALLSASLFLFAGTGSAAPKTPSESATVATAGTFDLAQLDQKPTAQTQTKPKYPGELRKQRITGNAVVGFVVDVEGSVRDAKVVKATHPEFGAAAVEAVSQWEFQPGMKAGQTVKTRLQVPVVFALGDK